MQLPTIRSLVVPVSDLDAPAKNRVLHPRCSARRTPTSRTTSGTTSTASRSVVGSRRRGRRTSGLRRRRGSRHRSRATLLDTGATERDAPRKVAPKVRVCVLNDADGNPIGLRGR